jgi:hypothetical protein
MWADAHQSFSSTLKLTGKVLEVDKKVWSHVCYSEPKGKRSLRTGSLGLKK